MVSNYTICKRKHYLFTLGLATCQLFTLNLLSQSVGINTDGSVPTELLHVKGGNVLIQDGIGGGRLMLYDGNNQFHTASGQPGTYNMYHGHVFKNISGEIARIGINNTSFNSYFNGNVGIGTNNPQAKLDIGGYDATNALFRSGNSSSGTDNSQLSFSYYGTTEYRHDIRTRHNSGSSEYNAIDFYLWTPAVASSARANKQVMTIEGTGNVGIGTTTPKSLLDLGTNYGDPGTYPNKICLYNGGPNAYYGFGISASDLDYFTAGNHRFYTDYAGSPGVERMVIESGGNVGIGTSDPVSKLSIAGGSANWSETTPGLGVGSIHLDPENTTDHFGNAITFGASDAGNGENAQAGIYVRSDGGYGTKMYFSTSNNYGIGATSRMMIDHNGNVGIGTTTPKSLLDLGTNYSDPSTYPNKITLWSGGTNNYFGFGISNGDLDYFTQSNHRFYTDYNGSPGAERMVIESGGNVGIGTSDPGEKLHLNGIVYAEGEGAGFIVDASGLKRVGFMKYAGTEGAFVHGNTTPFRIGQVNQASVTGGTFTEQMRIDNSGNVGIGNNNPGYKLDVTGAVRATDDFYGRYNVADTRSDNSAPATYSREVAFEFKDRSVLGSGGSGSYGGLMTIAPWNDATGNKNHQLYFNDGGIFYRTGAHGASWDSWQQLLTSSYTIGGDLSGTLDNAQIVANAVGNAEMADNAIGSTEIINGSIAAADLSQMGATTNQVLSWNGTTWVASTPSPGGLTSIATDATKGVTGGPITSTGTISLDYGSILTGGTRPVGNFGQFQGHGAYTDFNTDPAYWGWNYVQGNTNGPNTTSGQWYRQNISLGSEYPGRGAGGYSLELAYPRFDAANAGIWMRTVESGTIGSWTRIGGYTFSTGLSMNANGVVTNTGDTDASDDLTTSTTFAGDLSGTYNNLQINSGAVGTSEIATDGVNTDEIAANAVGNSEMADDAVGSAEIINGSILATDLSTLGGTTNGQVLTYNTATGWAAAAAPSGSDGNGIYSGSGTIPGVAGSTITVGGAGGLVTNLSSTGDFIIQDAGTPVFTVHDNGNVRIGSVATAPTSYKLQIDGKIKSNGINETSDARYKKDIQPISNALGKVNALSGVMYHWKTKEFAELFKDSSLQMGLIAQEVEKVIPEVVETDREGYKSVEYSHLVALLIEAIKEQEKQIKVLTSQVDALKVNNQQDEIDSLRKQVEMIQSYLSKEARK